MGIKSREHGSRNGSLDFIDWDTSIWQHIGASLDETKNLLAMPLNFFLEVQDPTTGELVVIDKAQVVYKRPEPTHIQFEMPLIAIMRDDVSPDMSRLRSPLEQYRVPSEGATRISTRGVLGWSGYESKDLERPYELSYTIECWARHRVVGQQMLQILMSKFPMLGGVISVTDSEGVVRKYSFTSTSTSDLTEVSSLVDKVVGYSVSILVKGELTLDRIPYTGTAMTGTTATTPYQTTDLNPGGGGLYSTGKTTIDLDATIDST